MITMLLYLFVAGCLLAVAFWIGGLIIDRLPVSDGVKNIFRILGLLILLILIVYVLTGFLPGHTNTLFGRP